MAFSEDLHLFAGLSGTENFFELWEEKNFSVVSIFDDEDVGDAFQRTDFKLLRTAAFTNRKLWDTLIEKNGTTFRSGGSREVCVRIVRRPRTMWNGLQELEKVHGAPNTQQERQPRHKVTTSSISHHEPMCQLWQHIRRSIHSAKPRRQLLDHWHL